MDERFKPQPRLGRVHLPDRNDYGYLVAPSKKAAAQVRKKYHYTDLVLNQGESSMCGGAAGEGWLVCGPVRNLQTPGWQTLYHEAQLVDEWPGTEPDYFGTSVRAIFKVLKARGFVKEYRWAFSLDAALAHILTTGPMVFGTTWYEGMMEADKHGFVHMKGEAVGGHAYLVNGANRDKPCPDGTIGAFRCVQSWGEDWGEKGRFWLSFKDATALILDYGEAATAIEAKPAA